MRRNDTDQRGYKTFVTSFKSRWVVFSKDWTQWARALDPQKLLTAKGRGRGPKLDLKMIV